MPKIETFTVISNFIQMSDFTIQMKARKSTGHYLTEGDDDEVEIATLPKVGASMTVILPFHIIPTVITALSEIHGAYLEHKAQEAPEGNES